MHKLRKRILPATLWLVVTTSSPALPQTPSASTEPAPARRDSHVLIWRDPGLVEELDLVGGPGGRERAPQAPFQFIREEMGGTYAKVLVKDARGRTWSVKFGSEVKAEPLASRIAWTAGYLIEPSYFVAGERIDGVKKLQRAAKYVRGKGKFKQARFELREGPKPRDEAGWKWDDNPLVGTQELNGLKIIMMLTSNWDSKDAHEGGRSNNLIFDYSDGRSGETHYIVSDWGATMGKWGSWPGRNKWDCEGYVAQTREFVKGLDENGEVLWGYEAKHHAKAMTKGIRITDVQWILQYLGRITDEQLRAGLEASGATPEEVECFGRAIGDRISILENLVQDPDQFRLSKVRNEKGGR